MCSASLTEPAQLFKADTGNGYPGQLRFAGRVTFDIVRWPVLAAVMIVGIGALYRFSMKDAPRGWLGFVTPGAVVAMLGWLVVSALFAVYTANFASYSKTYGSLATTVVLLLWLWLSSLLVLIGAEVDGIGDTG